jgi:hypothetical protein
MKLENCSTKGEYIKYILENSDYIRDIDVAVPTEILKYLVLNGVEGFWVTVYYGEDGGNVVRYCDVVSLATMVSKDIK